MPLFRTATCSLAFMLLVQSAVADDSNPWFGTWKLNRLKSSMAGDTYTISKSAGLYRMDDGALQYSFKDDGKKYSTLPSSTVSIKKVTTGEWLEIREVNGKETSRTTKRISADGMEMTSHKAGKQADGRPYSQDTTDRRVGGGSGLVGKWRRVQTSSDEAETLVYSDAGDGAMRMVSLEDKSVIVTKLDGAPVPVTGSDALMKVSMAVKATSPRSYTWTIFVNGKPYNQGINTLSAGGTSFEELNWIVSKPSEKYRVIYERQ